MEVENEAGREELREKFGKLKGDILIEKVGMEELGMCENKDKYISGGAFTTKVGRTTVTVNVFFNNEKKTTLNDRMRKMIREDVKQNNF